ncbi:MAG: hypothetical protein PVG65_00515 [Candidatus Thorarchaeota archaeon]|jgi:hypothetical protein
MALSKYNYEKLVDGIKLIARAIRVVADENNDKKRQEAQLLASDIVDRHFRDIEEIAGIEKDSYTGHINGDNNEKNTS